MDEYCSGSIRIRLFWSVTEISLRWNVVQWWIFYLFV